MNKEYRQYYNQFTKLPLVQSCKKETIDLLLEKGKFVHLEKGKHLVRMRESISYVYIQMTGKSIAYNITQQGRRKILFIYGKGRLINTDVFDVRTASMSYEIIEPGVIYVISVPAFEAILQKDFNLVKNIMIAQESKINRLSRQVKNNSSGISIQKKLLSKLWKLSKDFGVSTKEGLEIDLNLSITFLADMLGVPRESASRACSSLVKEGLIQIKGKRFIISHPNELSKMYSEERKKTI